MISGVQKMAYTVKEAAAALGVSESYMYSLVNSKGFPAKKIGGKILVPVKKLEAWVNDTEAVSE